MRPVKSAAFAAGLTLVLASSGTFAAAATSHQTHQVRHSTTHAATTKPATKHDDPTAPPSSAPGSLPSSSTSTTQSAPPRPAPGVQTTANADGTYTSTISTPRGTIASVTFSVDSSSAITNVVVTTNPSSPFSASSVSTDSTGVATFALSDPDADHTMVVTITDASGTPTLSTAPAPSSTSTTQSGPSTSNDPSQSQSNPSQPPTSAPSGPSRPSATITKNADGTYSALVAGPKGDIATLNFQADLTNNVVSNVTTTIATSAPFSAGQPSTTERGVEVILTNTNDPNRALAVDVFVVSGAPQVRVHPANQGQDTPPQGRQH